MNDQLRPAIRVGPKVRGFIWSIYTVAWTTALLTPHPAMIADALLGEEHAYYASKTLHVSAYVVMAILSGWLRASLPWRRLLLGFLSAHALGTEFFQNFVPYRYPSWTDVGWDHIGILWGLILSWGWWAEES
jgi:VanZ family protein